MGRARRALRGWNHRRYVARVHADDPTATHYALAAHVRLLELEVRAAEGDNAALRDLTRATGGV